MKSKIFFAVLVLLLYIIEFVDCADNDKDLTSTNSMSSNLQADSKLIIITSLILSQIDLVSCIYIIVRTYLRWKNNKKNPLPLDVRFPFYIALIEILISLLQTILWSRPTAVGAWSHPLCNSIGTFTIFLLAFVMNVVTFISFINWCKVKKDIEFNSGRYDYIIFLIATGFSIFYTLLGVGKYSKTQYWCVTQPSNKAVLYIIFAITMIHLALLLFFYFDTRPYTKRFRTNHHLSFNGQDLPLEDNNSCEEKKANKILSYTLVFGGQFILLILYIIISIGVSIPENAGAYLIRVLGITIGGLLISVQYIINENWRDKPIPLSSSLSSLSQKHHSNISQNSLQTCSIRNSINSQNPGVRLPFTKIQVEVVQHQTTSSLSQQSDWNA
uniref:Uncharacterized protein 58 n=1 Tax=Anthurium amnicola TaxID=1678845 RepID=A0A1D1ZIF8_9ARAE